MYVGRIAVNTAHKKWCQYFMAEQNKSTNLVKKVIKKTRMFNPFDTNQEINNILKRYEKSFW